LQILVERWSVEITNVPIRSCSFEGVSALIEVIRE